MEASNGQVNVDELMRRVRAEVDRRRNANEKREPSASASPVPVATPPAHLAWPNLAAIEQRLVTAESVLEVGTRLPPMSRTHGIKRRFAKLVARVFLRLAQLITRDQRAFNRAAVDSLRDLGLVVNDHAGKLAATTGQVTTLRRDLSSMAAELAEQVQGLRQQIESLSKELPAQFAQQTERLRQQIESLSKELPAQFAQQTQGLEQSIRRESVKLATLQTAQLLQERRLSVLLEEARRRLPEPMGRKELEAFAEESEHEHDVVYLDFEAVFRGSREGIKQRAREYLTAVREAAAGTPQLPVVDLGCGNGEWLQVLAEEGLRGVGVDSNRAFLESCRGRGLEVVEADCLAYLRGLPDASVGAVSAIHIVEHLPFPKVVKLIDESLRVLKPGGVLIFETPNPMNILVGACNFYIDPTHRNPLYPETMRFLFEARGLVRVSVRSLHPFEPEFRVPEDGSELAKRFNDYFYGPRDYAVLGFRA